MNYLSWAVLALAAYTLVAPLMRIATTGDPKVPSNVAALYANSVLVIASFGFVLYANQAPLTYLNHPKTPYFLAAGICLTVGILAYYRALSLGPVSVVAPVFGMFLATSSVVGVLFLDEPLTIRKGAGIGLAVVAVYLVSVE